MHSPATKYVPAAAIAWCQPGGAETKREESHAPARHGMHCLASAEYTVPWAQARIVKGTDNGSTAASPGMENATFTVVLESGDPWQRVWKVSTCVYVCSTTLSRVCHTVTTRCGNPALPLLKNAEPPRATVLAALVGDAASSETPDAIAATVAAVVLPK